MVPLLVALAAAIFVLGFAFATRHNHIKNIVEEIDLFLEIRGADLEEMDAERLDAALDEVVERLYAPGIHSLRPSIRKQREANLQAEYEKLWALYLDVYRSSIDPDATDAEAVQSLHQKSAGRFEVGDTVYVPFLDFYGEVESCNDDGTYTVCDVLERCHRIYEHEMERLDDDEDFDRL